MGGELEKKRAYMDGPQIIMNSLPVPHVQDLAASLDATSKIPDRYLRPEAEADPATDDGSVELPVIDLARARFNPEERAKLGLACQDWGFFQLINHGMPLELVENMKMAVAEFFKLPTEEKEAFAQLPNDFEGYGQVFVRSEEQKLDWGDMIAMRTLPQNIRKMRFWPTHPTTFRNTLDEYAVALKDVTSFLLRLIVENLVDTDAEIIMNKFNYLYQTVRISYYPPCPKPEKVIGLSPHSDPTLLTILLEVNDVQGIQMRKNNKWFRVKPIPGAFVVNIGDLLEIFSNGKYKSIEHRVAVNAEKDRMSLVAFHVPENKCVVGPFPQLMKGGVENYKSSTWEEMKMNYFSDKLAGKSYFKSLKLN